VRVLLKVINNKKHREEMGRNLKAITDEYFDLNKVVKHRLDLYRECFRLQTVNLKAGLAEVIQGKAVGDLVKRISDKNDTNL